MHDLMVLTTVCAFLLTIGFIFWRPSVNEAIPASIGAAFVLLSGSVSLADLGSILETISGAAITIIATIVMAIVLESFGFFYWAADLLAKKANGSGVRLFWLTNLFCFLMTLFVNNDGSILITTPILLMLLKNMGLKPHQKIPYLISGAIIATASSAPIGVSNIVNLIALKIVHMSLYMHTAMMFVPASLGLCVLAGMLYAIFYKSLPKQIPKHGFMPGSHPLKEADGDNGNNGNSGNNRNRTRFMRNVLIFVLCVRVSLFAASYAGIPVSLMAVIGSAALLVWRWLYLKVTPMDMVKKTPWNILVFAFGMYVIIYGLNNIGLTDYLIRLLQPIVTSSLLNASVLMGALLSVLSNLFNNHPALMVGTLTLTHMDLDPLTLKISYLASVIGSDIGSLMLPIGTLATLMWMHIVNKGGVKISWMQYLRVTIVAIPVTAVFTLVVLAYWVKWLF
ncbi:arsenic transporter [Paenibacillus sp. GCM10023250]|uniref:arsenic transporter n=1 Tax=Paenibacillus sp. GCM10023250 TaxID=3252648 RepID=UPI00361AF627